MSADAATIAAQMENTSLNSTQGFTPDSGSGPVPSTEPAVDSAATQPEAQETAAPAVPASEGKRVHVGNLAYATTEGELKSFFEQFNVSSVNIPKNPRTERPIGYAFVELESNELATKAIAELNGKELNSRNVSIDFADGRSGNNRGQARSARGRTRGRGGRNSNRTARNGADSAEANATKNGSQEAQEAPLADITNKSAASTGQNVKAENGRKSRPQKRGIPENGVPSETKIMVANIPFDTEESQLEEFFQEYQPKAVSIAYRPIPHFMIKKLATRNERRKGRGFAFITLATHELQEKACSEKNGAEFLGREIAVKVAIDSPDKVTAGSENSTTEGKEAATESAKTETTGSVPDANVEVAASA